VISPLTGSILMPTIPDECLNYLKGLLHRETAREPQHEAAEPVSCDAQCDKSASLAAAQVVPSGDQHKKQYLRLFSDLAVVMREV
jgi:hypothetical protein